MGVDLFASDQNAQEGLYCTKGNSAYQFHWGDLAEGRVSGQTKGGAGMVVGQSTFHRVRARGRKIAV